MNKMSVGLGGWVKVVICCQAVTNNQQPAILDDNYSEDS